MGPDVVCAVPARLESTRFPRKLLHPLNGKPLIAHTLERAAEAGCFSDVICVTDSPEIAAIADLYGFRSVLGGVAANGTERIARNLAALSADLIVNLQGDEPVFPPGGLRRLCAALQDHPEWVHLLVDSRAPSAEDRANPNRVKAALDPEGFLVDVYRVRPMYPAPLSRLQLGAYGYSAAYLRRYAARFPSARELSESHELLRAPDLAPVCVHAAPAGAPVDVPADLLIAAELLAAIGAGAAA